MVTGATDGPVIALDLSNYTTTPITGDVLDAWVGSNVRLAIVQAIDPPAGYPPSQTRAQIDALLADGRIAVAFYVFWWAGVGTDFLARQMALLAGYEGRLVCGIGDFEDTSVGRRQGLRLSALPIGHVRRIARQYRPPQRPRLFDGRFGLSTLVDDIQSWLSAIAAFPTLLGLPGVYSGPWYWGPYLGDPQIAQPGWVWWPAEYDGNPDTNVVTAWGGWVPPADLKQYIGSTSLDGVGGVDISSLSDDFLARLQAAQGGGNVSDPADLKRISDLETALHDVTDTNGEIHTAIQGISKKTTSKPVKAGLGAVLSRLDAVNQEFLS